MVERQRQANVDGGRSVRREVKLAPAELLALQVRADAQRVSVPRLLVESALADSAPETARERRELLAVLFRLERGLAATGNNINQIARAANTTAEVRSDLGSSLDELRRVVGDIDRAIASLSMTGEVR